MSEGQSKRVQHLARRGVIGQLLQPLILAVAVREVADQRESQKLKMDANLVRSTGVKDRFDQRRAAQTLQNPITRACGPPHVFVHGHAFAMRRMPRDRSANFATLPLNLRADDRMIRLIHASTCELVRNCQVGIIVLGDHEATAGVFVEAMNDAWPRDPTNSA
jgi:hypothetical protein